MSPSTQQLTCTISSVMGVRLGRVLDVRKNGMYDTMAWKRILRLEIPAGPLGLRAPLLCDARRFCASFQHTLRHTGHGPTRYYAPSHHRNNLEAVASSASGHVSPRLPKSSTLALRKKVFVMLENLRNLLLKTWWDSTKQIFHLRVFNKC